MWVVNVYGSSASAIVLNIPAPEFAGCAIDLPNEPFRRCVGIDKYGGDCRAKILFDSLHYTFDLALVRSHKSVIIR